MAPSLILFDLDETLFDHLHSSRAALDAIRRDHPTLRSVSLEELATEAYRILEQTHRRVLAGELTLQVARTLRLGLLFREFGIILDDAESREIAERHAAVYRSSRRAIDGARELLDALRPNHSVGIVTNNFRLEQESKLADCGLTDAIDFMITSEEVGVPKPASGIFQAALDRVHAQPSDAVMVGDNWEVDVLGAAEAGIRPVWFNRRGQDPPDSRPIDQMHSFEPPASALRIILGND